MKKIKIEDNWARCGKCGHKLFRIVEGEVGSIEVKCHSCKEVNSTYDANEVCLIDKGLEEV